MPFDPDKYLAGRKSGFNPDAYLARANRSVARTEESDTTELESGLRGAAQTATLGFADEAVGGVEALWEKAKGNPEEFGKLYAKSRDESRRNFLEAKKANPGSYLTGEIVGGVGSAFIPGLNIAKGASLAKTVGQSALAGGAYGLGSSNADNAEELAKDAGVGALIGAGGGAVAHGIGKGIEKLSKSDVASRVMNKIADKSDEGAERLAARSLGAERGTIKKLGDEKVRAAGRYALDEGIVTPLASAEKMAARNELLQRQAGEGMESVYKAIDDQGASTFNPLETATKVEQKIGDFWRSPINKGETNQLENTLESILLRGQGADRNVSLAEAQILKEELGKVANWKNAVSITDKEQMAREAYRVVSESIDEAVEKGAREIGAKGLLDTLKKSKKTFSNSKAAEELLENRVAREQGNKMFGLTDAGWGGPAVAVAGPKGLAVVGAKKGFERYGSQTAAVALDKIAKIARSSPEKLGKYAPVIQNAIKRGKQELHLINYVLQDEPEYAKIMQQLASED